MEAKFFTEIEKKMDIKTIKDFEKEVRTKIYTEVEKLRAKNSDLDKIINVNEIEMWSKIKNGDYSWLKLKDKKKLFHLIDIYSNFDNIINDVKTLNKKVDKIKKLKEQPEESE